MIDFAIRNSWQINCGGGLGYVIKNLLGESSGNKHKRGNKFKSH